MRGLSARMGLLATAVAARYGPRSRGAAEVASETRHPMLLRQRLGGELRRLREDRLLRLEDVAGHVGVAPSTLSRIESGKATERTSYVAVMLDLFGVDDLQVRAKLADLAREGQRKGWWVEYADVLSADECTYLGLEAAGSLVRSFSVQVVPDLVQTEEYAASVCRAMRPDFTGGQVGRLVSGSRAPAA